MYLFGSCWLDCGAIGLRLPVNDVAASPKKMPKLNLPRDGKARSKIMSDLCEASGLVVAMLDVPADSALDSGSLSARRAAGNAGKAAAVSSADGSAGSHWVLSIPASSLGCIGGSTGSAGIRLETACIGLKHARNDRELSASGTVKDLETKLDMLLLPAVSSDRFVSAVS